jgi:hypothetical protein
MQATLYLPGATPRPLTAAELAALNPHVVSGQLSVNFEATAATLRELLGTDIPGEVIACGPKYLVLGPENAADYGFAATPNATSDFTRLAGVETDDEPLVGPMVIIEA